MPISKQEAHNAFENLMNGEIEKACADIDRAIQSNWIPGQTVTIAIRGYKWATVERIKTIYAAKGWRVERHSDQRDGDYLSLQ